MKNMVIKINNPNLDLTSYIRFFADECVFILLSTSQQIYLTEQISHLTSADLVLESIKGESYISNKKSTIVLALKYAQYNSKHIYPSYTSWYFKLYTPIKVGNWIIENICVTQDTEW